MFSARSSAPRNRWGCRVAGSRAAPVTDAQMMAQLGPMGMIFVPSVAGISHSPRELTKWEDCANGANVLLAAVLEMDKV
jgi:acetylornithine deacetylase/succinyl-diaminopimelate desuccinylase-like protein